MGTILSFAVPPQSKRRKTRELPDDGGAVVIFPGVRVERTEVDLSARYGTQSTTKRKETDPVTRR